MQMSISKKLVIAFTGLTVVVLTATLSLARWSFEQGFLDYINALELTRLQRVQRALTEEYLAAGSNWSTLSEQRFGNLLRTTQALGFGPPGGSSARPAPPPEAGRARMPPRGPGPRAMPPTAIYDNEGRLIAGPGGAINDAQAIRLAVVLNNTVIGELRSEPRRELSSTLETTFSRQQLNTSWLIGACSLALALLLSLLLAKGLLAPVKRMLDGVSRLSAGDYQQRWHESRSDELGELTRNLDQLATTLEANQSSRKRLLADVSHELRTPLSVLTGEIEALQDGVRRFDRPALDSLDQEVQRLRYLVGDLYELSLTDLGGLSYRLEPVAFDSIVSATVKNKEGRMAAEGITLDVQLPEGDPVMIEGDARRLEQLLNNLLENSLAYTDAPGQINLGLTHDNEMLTLTIEDSSPGANEQECEQLFEPLYRLDGSRSRRSGGAGLGLAICRNIVTAHRGSIQARPAALGGLSIRIEIPLMEATA